MGVKLVMCMIGACKAACALVSGCGRGGLRVVRRYVPNVGHCLQNIILHIEHQISLPEGSPDLQKVIIAKNISRQPAQRPSH